MENKNILTNTNPFYKTVNYFQKFVDDIIYVYSMVTKRQLSMFSKHRNDILPLLSFTTEHESNNSINYPYHIITKHIDYLKIYIKPTSTNHNIPVSPNHPKSYKLFLIHRALNLSMNPYYFINEINVIKSIAQANDTTLL